MKLLALETSSAIGSVALAVGGEVLERVIESPRAQTEQLLMLTDELLAGAGLHVRDLDAVTFGRGPGSFTGLRVAAAIAQGLALATDVPLVPVSSLLCLAEGAQRLQGVGQALVVVDARMGEVYSGLFALGPAGPIAVGPERLSAPERVRAPAERPWVAVGDGFAAHASVLAGITASAAAVRPQLRPAARDLLPQAARDLAAGRTTPPTAALPVYLRGEDAWTAGGH